MSVIAKETLILTGELARDPELKYTTSGTPVCSLSIPVNIRIKDEDITKWWRVSIFGKMAESCKKNLRKGSLVQITGETNPSANGEPRVYEKDGQYHATYEAISRHVEFMANFGGGSKSDEPDVSQDEIPF